MLALQKSAMEGLGQISTHLWIDLQTRNEVIEVIQEVNKNKIKFGTEEVLVGQNGIL